MTCISVAILGKWQDFNSTMSDILTKNIPAAFGSGSLGDAAIKTAKIYPDFLLTLESIIDKRIKDSYSLPFIIAESLKQFGYAFIGLFLIGIPSILLLLSMLYYSIGALLSVAIGVAFGPPIIALLPWDRTSWLAENWLRYMITNLLTVTVALFIISLALSAQVLINQNIEAAMSDFTLNPMKGQLIIGKMLIAGLLMLFLALFIGKAEGIASALISGGSSGASGGMARSVQLISRSISGASKMTGGGKPPGGGASKTTGGGKPLEK